MKKILGIFLLLFTLVLTGCSAEPEGNLLPEGAVYYIGAPSQMLGDYEGADRVINEGEPFPDKVSTGDTFVLGDYEYRYNMCFITSHSGVDYPVWQENPSQNGWGVRARVVNEKEYAPMESEICSLPVTMLTHAFYSCDLLESAPVLSENATDISWAFGLCSSLTSPPVIPEGVLNMSEAFFGCESLVTPPVLPEGVQNIYYAFYKCYALASAPRLPASLTNVIGTFLGCTSLESFEGSTGEAGDFSGYSLPDVTTLRGTFSGCEKMTVAPEIPLSVTDLTYTFRGAKALRKAPDTSANTIDKYVYTFAECASLAEPPVLSPSAIDISGAFNACSSLVRMPEIPEGTLNMDNTFNSCTSLAEATTIPAFVDSMHKTFYGCSSLGGTLVVEAEPSYYAEALEGTAVEKIVGFDLRT